MKGFILLMVGWIRESKEGILSKKRILKFEQDTLNENLNTRNILTIELRSKNQFWVFRKRRGRTIFRGWPRGKVHQICVFRSRIFSGLYRDG